MHSVNCSDVQTKHPSRLPARRPEWMLDELRNEKDTKSPSNIRADYSVGTAENRTKRPQPRSPFIYERSDICYQEMNMDQVYPCLIFVFVLKCLI